MAVQGAGQIAGSHRDGGRKSVNLAAGGETIQRPGHTTVVAYTALVLAIGAGGAYAVDKVTSRDIRDGSIRSADLRNGKAVGRADVRPNSLGGDEINESTLDSGQILQLAGFNDAGDCDPSSASMSPCLSVAVELSTSARLLVIATGNQYTALNDNDGSEASCEVRLDEGDQLTSLSAGELGESTHRADSANGFARTVVTEDPVPAGSHDVALVCAEFFPDVRIGTPTIAVLAISTGG